MKSKMMLSLPVFSLVGIFLLISYSRAASSQSSITEPTHTTSKQVITSSTVTTTQANWWDKLGTPTYGGILTIRASSLDAVSFDPHIQMGPDIFNFDYETLFDRSWTYDRSIFNFMSGPVQTEQFMGLLAKSWEWTDSLTITVHLRQGIHWQKKSPVNGRELTADDVVFTFDRILGTGSGFTQPNPFYAPQISGVKQVIATDKYTVQFKMKQPTALTIFQILGTVPSIVAPEWADLGGPPTTFEFPKGGPPGPPGPPKGLTPSGPLNDWHNNVGTGPFMITGFTSGSSMTWERNPDYWGHDERFPKNQIPYIDKHKVVAIPDLLTSIAALRTGKIDLIAEKRNGLTWQIGAQLAKTDPDIRQAYGPGPGVSLDMRCDKAPFTDIKVRQALNMAIDRKLIADSHYGGTVDGTPSGALSPIYEGWVTPYNQWPAELRQIYSYNPTQAKKLLADAGYPNGFNTNCVVSSGDDTQLLQIIKSQFADIGVNMEIRAMEPAAEQEFAMAGKHDQMVLTNATALPMGIAMGIQHRTSANSQHNFTFNNDAHYDDLVNQALAATTLEEAKRLVNEADIYTAQQCWAVNVCGVSTPFAWQPWLKGYSGEEPFVTVRARIWIDQDLKTSIAK